jgi:hypothetical protein
MKTAVSSMHGIRKGKEEQLERGRPKGDNK